MIDMLEQAFKEPAGKNQSKLSKQVQKEIDKKEEEIDEKPKEDTSEDILRNKLKSIVRMRTIKAIKEAMMSDIENVATGPNKEGSWVSQRQKEHLNETFQKMIAVGLANFGTEMNQNYADQLEKTTAQRAYN